MAEKKDNGSLKKLREYIAHETERLENRGGRVYHIDLDEVDEEGTCLIPAPRIDPLARDVDVLFNQSGRRRSDKTDKSLQ